MKSLADKIKLPGSLAKASTTTVQDRKGLTGIHQPDRQAGIYRKRAAHAIIVQLRETVVPNEFEGGSLARGGRSTGEVALASKRTLYLIELESDAPGQRKFVDSHGRILHTFHPVAGMADIVSIIDADGNALLELEYDGVTYHKTESDAEGRVIKDTYIDPDSGDVTEVDFRLDQVTMFRDAPDGSVTAIVFRGGSLAYTESIACDGTQKRVVYERMESSCVARTAKVVGAGEVARTSVVYGTADSGRRLIFVAHTISKEKTEWKFDGSRQPFELSIITPGAHTVLKRVAKTELLEGATVDAAGSFLWDVSMDGRGRLLLRDESSGDPSCISPRWTGGGFKSAVPVVESVQLDLDAGALERFDDSGERILQYFSGRRDVYAADGSILCANRSGSRSCFSPQGDVVINHVDGSAEFLNVEAAIENGTIELYQGDGDEMIVEKLSDVERLFLQDRGNSIDPRDFLRMHCRLKGKGHQIDGVLKQLADLSEPTEGGVATTVEQLQLVSACILHHVAYPEEVVTGRCATGGAAAVQVDFVLENPTRYAAIVKECIRTGQLRLVGGATVSVLESNIMAADSTGRDIASRIFQTALLCSILHPDVNYVASRVGLGQDPGRGGVGGSLEALSAETVSNALYLLGGGETCVVELRTPGDLIAVHRATTQKSMIVAVNLSAYPFSCSRSAIHPHLLNVVSVDHRAKRVTVNDPSGFVRDQVSVDEVALFNNMVTVERAAGVAIVHGGLHGRRFVISAGSLVKRR